MEYLSSKMESTKNSPNKRQYEQKPWIDTRLKPEEIQFLWDAINDDINPNKESFSHELAGNIFRSELIEDKDNWFYETVLKKLSEKMHYDPYTSYYDQFTKENDEVKFKLNKFWVNYQRQHEFNPIHNHTSLYSFVVFMKIPTNWEEQHALPISANSNSPYASDFAFVWPKDGQCVAINLPLSSKDEGRMLFFPATLQHMVYPFYGTEEKRITISGNIVLGDIITSEKSVRKEKMLEIMEEQVKILRKEVEDEEKSR